VQAQGQPPQIEQLINSIVDRRIAEVVGHVNVLADNIVERLDQLEGLLTKLGEVTNARLTCRPCRCGHRGSISVKHTYCRVGGPAAARAYGSAAALRTPRDSQWRRRSHAPATDPQPFRGRPIEARARSGRRRA